MKVTWATGGVTWEGPVGGEGLDGQVVRKSSILIESCSDSNAAGASRDPDCEPVHVANAFPAVMRHLSIKYLYCSSSRIIAIWSKAETIIPVYWMHFYLWHHSGSSP